jgi:hypothetical protein
LNYDPRSVAVAESLPSKELLRLSDADLQELIADAAYTDVPWDTSQEFRILCALQELRQLRRDQLVYEDFTRSLSNQRNVIERLRAALQHIAEKDIGIVDEPEKVYCAAWDLRALARQTLGITQDETTTTNEEKG